jgi:hypothetical protein
MYLFGGNVTCMLTALDTLRQDTSHNYIVAATNVVLIPAYAACPPQLRVSPLLLFGF